MEAMLRQLLADALKRQVSDIHFTILDRKLHIAMREISGMKDYMVLPDARLMSYLRYRCKMNLSNALIPQTGQMEVRIDEQELFLRFSYLPALGMESGVLRILNQNLEIALENLSFLPAQTACFKRFLSRSFGLILLSGPTGSGKTTTMYAMLEYLKQKQRNIITLEDPIEMRKSGMIQIQINEKQGLTYAKSLKQILRHDPDVIMVGEIRDSETAKIVVRSALTGHLVLSTIHAKDCCGVLLRMMELGVNKTDLMQSLIGITSQRILKGKGRRGRVCIYEIMEEKHLQKWNATATSDHELFLDVLAKAVESGYVTKKEAAKEGMLSTR